MKISISSFCSECFKELHQYKKEGKIFEEFEDHFYSEIEVNDENIYEFKCPRGHKTITRFQPESFEILFDLAAMALLDGYTREAVSGIASSLEKFMEFYILVVCLENRVDFKSYLEFRKLTSKQSERQLGAFFILKILNKKEILLEEKKVAFRNKVIHQGYIPTTNEVIEYGEYALSFIFLNLKELAIKTKDFLNEATLINLNKNSEKIEKNVEVWQSVIPTIISFTNLITNSDPNYGSMTFKDALLKMSKDSFYTSFYKKNIDI